jgi:hypothetical protein
MSITNIRELGTLAREIGSRLVGHSVESSKSHLPAILLRDHERGMKAYESAREKKEPYSLKMITSDHDGNRVELYKFGFFTKRGLEISASIDESKQEVAFGTRAFSESDSTFNDNQPISLPFDLLAKELQFGNRREDAVLSAMNNLAETMSISSLNRLQINRSLEKMRDDLMYKK